MTKFLTKEQIVNVNDLETKEFYVKEWKASVRIRTLTSRERDDFEASLFSKGDLKKPTMSNFRAKLVSMVLVDGEGKTMFNPQEAEQLGRKSASALDAIFTEAQKMSGITKQDVEDMTKN